MQTRAAYDAGTASTAKSAVKTGGVDTKNINVSGAKNKKTVSSAKRIAEATGADIVMTDGKKGGNSSPVTVGGDIVYIDASSGLDGMTEPQIKQAAIGTLSRQLAGFIASNSGEFSTLLDFIGSEYGGETRKRRYLDSDGRAEDIIKPLEKLLRDDDGAEKLAEADMSAAEDISAWLKSYRMTVEGGYKNAGDLSSEKIVLGQWLKTIDIYIKRLSVVRNA